MGGVTAQRLAQVGQGILLLIIIRSLAEFFRLQYLHGHSLTIAQVSPFIAGALVAALALAVAAACHAAAFHRVSIATTVATVVGLLVYKIAAVG
jgi:hypothetical protein